MHSKRRRAEELQTAAEIARDTTGTLALDDLLSRAVELIRDRFSYYHATIFLLDDSVSDAVVHPSTGQAGKEMKARGHKLAVGSNSVIGYVTRVGEPLVINDTLQDPIHRPNPLLPETRAELGIPLKIGDRDVKCFECDVAPINNQFWISRDGRFVRAKQGDRPGAATLLEEAARILFRHIGFRQT